MCTATANQSLSVTGISGLGSGCWNRDMQHAHSEWPEPCPPLHSKTAARHGQGYPWDSEAPDLHGRSPKLPPHASAAQALALPSKVARAVSAGSWAVLQSTHVTAPMQGTTPGHQTQVQEVGDHAEASFNTGAGLFWVKEEMPFPGSPVFPKARGPGTVQCQMSSGPWKSLSSSAPPGYWWLRDWQLCPGCHGGTYPLEQGLSSVKTSSQASRFVHSAGWPWSTSPKHKRLKSQMPKKMSQDVWRTPVP